MKQSQKTQDSGGIAYVTVDSENASMKTAIEKARAGLDGFLERWRHPQAGEEFSVKVGITDGGKNEYFWMINLAEQGGKFTAEINNDPVDVHSVKLGQRYPFEKSEIVDWIINKDGKIHGGYTVRALLGGLSPEEAAETRAMLADD